MSGARVPGRLRQKHRHRPHALHPSENDDFAVAVDVMLLRVLGHRARWTRSRARRWCGSELAAAGLPLASVAAFREDLTSLLLIGLTALTVLRAPYIGVLARAHWRCCVRVVSGSSTASGSRIWNSSPPVSWLPWPLRAHDTDEKSPIRR